MNDIPTKAKLTKTLVEKVPPNTVVWDTEVSGFLVRRQKHKRVYGVKTRIAGRQKWIKVGDHGIFTVDKARQEARRILGEVAAGNDPAKARADAKKGLTVSEAVERFLVEHVQAKRKQKTYDQYADILRRIVVPKLGSKRVKDIQHSDIVALQQSQRQHPIQANRMLAILSKFFNLSESWGERPQSSNPCQHVEKFPETKKEDYLGPDDIAALGYTLETAWPIFGERPQNADLVFQTKPSPHAVAAIWLLLLTGARKGEILSLKWEWLDRQRGTARLPDTKTGPDTIYLGPEAFDVLDRIPRVEENPYVIVGHREGRPMVNLQKPWRAITEAAGIPPYRLHDLRHTFASYFAYGGHSMAFLTHALRHSHSHTTDRYKHLADHPVRVAVEQNSGFIADIARGMKPR